MTIGKGKRLRDPNELTKSVVDRPEKPTALDSSLHDSTLERQQPPGLMSPETITYTMSPPRDDQGLFRASDDLSGYENSIAISENPSLRPQDEHGNNMPLRAVTIAYMG
jgi:hypothetical protein